MTEEQKNTLFAGFIGAINSGKWNGDSLKQQVMPLSPEKFVSPIRGIGHFIGQVGCEKIITRFYTDFLPRNRWGKTHKDLLKTFWNPGAWTLDNATFFGAPLNWLSQPEKDKYDEQLVNRAKNGG